MGAQVALQPVETDRLSTNWPTSLQAVYLKLNLKLCHILDNSATSLPVITFLDSEPTQLYISVIRKRHNTSAISRYYDIQLLRRYVMSYHDINIKSIYCPALVNSSYSYWPVVWCNGPVIGMCMPLCSCSMCAWCVCKWHSVSSLVVWWQKWVIRE